MYYFSRFHSHLTQPASHRHQSPLGKLYIASFLHDLGLGMLALFIPFYLYDKGWPLLVVIVYLLAFLLLKPTATRLSAFSLIKRGIAKTILISNILRLCFTLALFTLDTPSVFNYGLLALIIILDVISIKLYTVAWDSYFPTLTKRAKAGRQAGLHLILMALTGVLAPIISGFVAQFWGFQASIVIGIVIATGLLLFSVAPLRAARQSQAPAQLKKLRQASSFRRIWRLYKAAPKDALLALIGTNLVFNVLLPLWTLYLAIAIFVEEVYGPLGILLGLSSAIAILASFLAGWLR